MRLIHGNLQQARLQTQAIVFKPQRGITSQSKTWSNRNEKTAFRRLFDELVTA